MNIRPIIDALPGWPAQTWLLIAVPLALVAFAVMTKLSSRPDRRVTALATVIGLGWSAQGMWDSAVHTYGVAPTLAAVLFFLFEAFMVGNMLRAGRYRHDPVRRTRPVRFVWTLALVMGTVVSLAEGLQQAPLRFAVPLLVAGNWFIDLTADDDPAARGQTSWRWTPRRLGLVLGLLEPGARDAVTVDRDRLTDRMTLLAFRHRHGWRWLDEMLRRPERLARLALAADDAIVREMHSRLERSSSVLVRPAPEETAPAEGVPSVEPPPAPEPEPIRLTIVPPSIKSAPITVPDTTDGRPRGWHKSPDGVWLRKPELHDDAVRRFTPAMSNADLAGLYDPPLGERTAQEIGARARRQRVNGSVPI